MSPDLNPGPPHPLTQHRNQDIATTLVGMTSPQEVEANVQTTLQALGRDSSQGGPGAGEGGGGRDGFSERPDEAVILAELAEILSCVKDSSWLSGRPENN